MEVASDASNPHQSLRVWGARAYTSITTGSTIGRRFVSR